MNVDQRRVLERMGQVEAEDVGQVLREWPAPYNCTTAPLI